MKKWYLSKTLWVNVIAAAAGVTQAILGKAIINPEAQVAILGIVNMILRMVTKQELSA
jgi:hypothetical protein